MPETILRSQKTFQPGEELDAICCAVQGFPKEAPLGWKQWDNLPMAMGLATWVQGTIRKLCSQEVGWLQRQARQQRDACNKKKVSTNQGHAFKGALSVLLLFLRFWAF